MTPEKERAMKAQSAEFDAAAGLMQQYRRIALTAVVEDDYPSVRHEYEKALNAFLTACAMNGRKVHITAADIDQGLKDCGEGKPYGDHSPGEIGYMAAYAVLRCCHLIPAGDRRVPERIGRTVQEMTKAPGDGWNPIATYHLQRPVPIDEKADLVDLWADGQRWTDHYWNYHHQKWACTEWRGRHTVEVIRVSMEPTHWRFPSRAPT